MYGQNGYVTYYNTSGQHYNNYYANNPNRHHRPKFESNRHFETPSNGAPQPDQQGPQRYGTFPQKRWYEKWSTRQPRNNADSSPRPKHDPEEVKGLVVQGVSKRAKPKARANPKPLQQQQQQQQDQQHESQSQQQVDPNVEEQLAKESKIDGKEVSTGTGGGVSPDEQKPYLEGPSSSQSSPVDCSISGNNSPRSNGNAALPSNNRNQFGRRNYSNQKNTLGNLSNQQNQKQRNGFKQWDNSSMPKNHGYRNNYNNNYSNHHPNTNHHHANMGGYGMGYIKSLKPFQNYAPASIQAPERCSQEDPLEPRHSFNDEDVNSVVKILREFASDMEVTAEDEPPEALLNGSCWDQLSSDIWSRYVESMQKKDLLLKKINAWILLMKSMKQIFPDFNLIAPDRFSCESATNTYKLYLVGSTCSGFGLRSSDVDTCIMVTNYEVDQHAHAFPFLQQLKLDIENLRIPGGPPVDLRTMNLISAKVPILKFEDVQWGIQFDVNCNNPVGVRNTHLLFHYSQIEWRVRPLVVLVKVWAKCHGINDAKDMTLSSYSLTLMVIHYLQCGVQPPVLPCLQKMSNKFSPDQPLHMLSVLNFPHERENIKPFLSKNHQPLGELLLGFFEYYSVFDFNQNAISVRLGSTIPVESCRSKRTPKNDPGQWKFISIEEPFEQTNTARAVFELSRFHYILDVFRHCAKVLEERRTLDCIFDRILPMRTISTIVGNHPGPAAGNIPVGNHLAIPATINNPNPTVTRVSTAPFQL